MNLYEYTYFLVRQIPAGMVSSYGAVAKALGDIRASRAVGRMMNQNPDPDTMPCYKIVYSDGRIGGFGRGIADKIRRLKQDNIMVKNNKIMHFENIFFDDFKTTHPLKTCRKKQIQLRERLNLDHSIDESVISTVAGFDIAYPKNDFDKACIACVMIDYKRKEIIETKTLFQHIYFPYIPTYLTFRETPLIQSIYKKLETEPTVLMLDGNGILHPFHFGVASHVGVLLNKPTIGVAKSLLCGTQQQDSTIAYDHKILGKALYANRHVKNPVYISPGHLIDLPMAYNITSSLSKYKHPEPVRFAHLLATKTIKEA